MYIFKLSQENVGLAVLEVKTLLFGECVYESSLQNADLQRDSQNLHNLQKLQDLQNLQGLQDLQNLQASQHTSDKRLLLWNGKFSKEKAKRLALTNTICKIIASGDKNTIINKAKSVRWNTIISGTFKVEGADAKKIASIIWNALKNPQISMKYPDTKISVIKGKKRYLCIEIYRNKKGYSLRRTHLNPAPHPSSMNPKLARALINISGIRKNQALHDMFCGAGGILLEAGLMGLKVVGVDIDESMLARCDVNLRHHHIKDYKLINADSTRLKKKSCIVVSDLPYGRNTKSNHEISELFRRFLANRRGRCRRMVLVLPSTIDAEQIILSEGFILKAKFTQYVHKSLTRKIYVLENSA